MELDLLSTLFGVFIAFGINVAHEKWKETKRDKQAIEFIKAEVQILQTLAFDKFKIVTENKTRYLYNNPLVTPSKYDISYIDSLMQRELFNIDIYYRDRIQQLKEFCNSSEKHFSLLDEITDNEHKNRDIHSVIKCCENILSSSTSIHVICTEILENIDHEDDIFHNAKKEKIERNYSNDEMIARRRELEEKVKTTNE